MKCQPSLKTLIEISGSVIEWWCIHTWTFLDPTLMVYCWISGCTIEWRSNMHKNVWIPYWCIYILTLECLCLRFSFPWFLYGCYQHIVIKMFPNEGKTQNNHYTWSSLQSIVYMITFNPWSFSPFYTYKLFRPFLICPETVLFCTSILRGNIRKVLNSPTEYIVIYSKRGKNKWGQVFLTLKWLFGQSLGPNTDHIPHPWNFPQIRLKNSLIVNSKNISYASSVKSVLAAGTLSR